MMKNKVTLRELVGTKIIYAVLVAAYYWMWARSDWHDYYETIQYVVLIFTGVFLCLQAERIRKYKKENVDELAEKNLIRTNSICFKISVIVFIVIAFMGALKILNGITMGYAIVAFMLVLSVLRLVIFTVMDKKGI